MNRFVYFVHFGYQDADQDSTAAGPARASSWHVAQRLVRLPGQLRRYLPDTQVKISDHAIRRDPDVIQLAVLTTLDEATTDAAFVRFIRDCKSAQFALALDGELDAGAVPVPHRLRD
jgi:hypothetical protein